MFGILNGSRNGFRTLICSMMLIGSFGLTGCCSAPKHSQQMAQVQPNPYYHGNTQIDKDRGWHREVTIKEGNWDKDRSHNTRQGGPTAPGVYGGGDPNCPPGMTGGGFVPTQPVPGSTGTTTITPPGNLLPVPSSSGPTHPGGPLLK